MERVIGDGDLNKTKLKSLVENLDILNLGMILTIIFTVIVTMGNAVAADSRKNVLYPEMYLPLNKHNSLINPGTEQKSFDPEEVLDLMEKITEPQAEQVLKILSEQ